MAKQAVKIEIRSLTGGPRTTWEVCIIQGRRVATRHSGAIGRAALFDAARVLDLSAVDECRLTAAIESSTYYVSPETVNALTGVVLSESSVDSVIDDLVNAGILATWGTGPVGRNVDREKAESIVRSAVYAYGPR